MVQYSGVSSVTEHSARDVAVDDRERLRTFSITVLQLNTASNVTGLGKS